MCGDEGHVTFVHADDVGHEGVQAAVQTGWQVGDVYVHPLQWRDQVKDALQTESNVVGVCRKNHDLLFQEDVFHQFHYGLDLQFLEEGLKRKVYQLQPICIYILIFVFALFVLLLMHCCSKTQHFFLIFL